MLNLIALLHGNILPNKSTDIVVIVKTGMSAKIVYFCLNLSRWTYEHLEAIWSYNYIWKDESEIAEGGDDDADEGEAGEG
jgi:hypothetical protein